MGEASSLINKNVGTSLPSTQGDDRQNDKLKLNVCLNCGSMPALRLVSRWGNYRQVICSGCGIRGPVKENKMEARLTWNRFHPPITGSIEHQSGSPSSSSISSIVNR